MAFFVPNKEKQYGIIIIGAGGTGSWLSSYLAKAQDRVHSITLVDGDAVEPKNLTRQNFMRNDIGKNKASVVARAASRMIDTDIIFKYSTVEEFITSTEDLDKIVKEISSHAIPLIVGAVDNNGSRKIIHDYVESYKGEIIWIDAGNNERFGQVILLPKNADGDVIEGFSSPFDLHEEFQVIDGDERRPDQISCAEQSESAPQAMAANVLSATTLFMVINKIITGEAVITNELLFDSFNIGLKHA